MQGLRLPPHTERQLSASWDSDAVSVLGGNLLQMVWSVPEEENLVSLLVKQRRGCQKPMLRPTKNDCTGTRIHGGQKVRLNRNALALYPLLPCIYTANELAPTFGLALLSRQIRTITAIDPGRVTIHTQILADFCWFSLSCPGKWSIWEETHRLGFVPLGLCLTWRTFRIFVIFFSARGRGKGESEAPGARGIHFLLKLPGGGGFQEGSRGREGLRRIGGLGRGG